jgi:hypothetical protein
MSDEKLPESTPGPETSATGSSPSRVPAHQPDERFWPYVHLPEEPDEAELVALDPDLRDALFGRGDRPFSYTLVFPRFDGPEYERALEIARRSAEYREVGEGAGFRIRARFLPSDVLQVRDLFEIVGRFDDTQVLVDDRPLPYGRELWLPLLWYLLPR